MKRDVFVVVVAVAAAMSSDFSEKSSAMVESARKAFSSNFHGDCPGGLCEQIQKYSEVLLVVLVLDGLFFLATLLPPIFSWSKRKADGKKRVFFAFLACVTFYFWLAFLALNSVYCFGFLAHEGPCRLYNRTTGSNVTVSITSTTHSIEAATETPLAPFSASDAIVSSSNEANPVASPSVLWHAFNDSCSNPLSPHEADLRNLTVINVLIIVVLLIVLIANAREGKTCFGFFEAFERKFLKVKHSII